jgi:ATP-dependent DNA ligase
VVAIPAAGVYMLSAPLAFIRPCSPITAKNIPAGDGWLHEPKLDGYRRQIVKEGRTVRLYSRVGVIGQSVWYLAEALRDIPSRSAVIDGALWRRHWST